MRARELSAIGAMCFSPRHVDAFKRSAGDLLIELGYEKDGRWGP